MHGSILASLLRTVAHAGAQAMQQQGGLSQAFAGLAGHGHRSFMPDVLENVAPTNVKDIQRLLGRLPRTAPVSPFQNPRVSATPPGRPTSGAGPAGRGGIGSLGAFQAGQWNIPGSLAAFNRSFPGQSAAAGGVSQALEQFRAGQWRRHAPPPLPGPPPPRSVGETFGTAGKAAGIGASVGGIMGGAGGAAGGAIGAAIGSIIAPGIGTAIGGILGAMVGKVPGSIMKTVAALDAFARETLEGSRDLRRFNGQINAAFARLERQQLILSGRSARATAGTTDLLATQIERLNSEVAPIKNDLKILGNLLAGTGVEVVRTLTRMFELWRSLDPVMRLATELLRRIEKTLNRQERVQVAEDLRRIADGEILPKNRPPVGVRGDWGDKRKRGG